jgi:hypothetical protein
MTNLSIKNEYKNDSVSSIRDKVTILNLVIFFLGWIASVAFFVSLQVKGKINHSEALAITYYIFFAFSTLLGLFIIIFWGIDKKQTIVLFIFLSLLANVSFGLTFLMLVIIGFSDTYAPAELRDSLVIVGLLFTIIFTVATGFDINYIIKNNKEPEVEELPGYAQRIISRGPDYIRPTSPFEKEKDKDEDCRNINFYYGPQLDKNTCKNVTVFDPDGKKSVFESPTKYIS